MPKPMGKSVLVECQVGQSQKQLAVWQAELAYWSRCWYWREVEKLSEKQIDGGAEFYAPDGKLHATVRLVNKP